MVKFLIGAIAVAAAALSATPAFAQAASADAAPAKPAYLVVTGRTLDRAKMGQYAAALRPIYAKNGGRYVGFGGPGRGAVCLAGPCEGRSAVIVQFPDAETMDAFWWGPDYRAAIKLRDRAGVFNVVGLEGAASAVSAPAGGIVVFAFGADAPASAVARISAAAAKAGGRLLNAPERAPAPYEGDAAYSAYVLAGFPDAASRAAFLDAPAVKRLIRTGGVMALTADAPPQG